ncbi:response regulator transcription factor [Thalassotalea ganghwensis]
MSQATINILLIEDDEALAELIADYLRDNYFEVTTAHTAKQAKVQADQQHFDLIVCDVMLPDGNGFHLIKTLFQTQQGPVIFLTALGDDASHIEGLEVGAVDYIAKPISPPVLLARINAALRKVQSNQGEHIVQFGPFIFDSRTKTLLNQKQRVDLTNQEFDILWLFINHLNKPLARDFLFENIVGRAYDGSDRAADLKISRLRKKLQLLELNQLSIESIRNQGYVFRYEEA